MTLSFPRSGVEGFDVVTRVSRNGDALTSEVLRRAGSISRESVRTRLLSSVSLRHRHNVAVGTETMDIVCGTSSKRRCLFGLVSAPNRISFGCRISHSLTTYRNTVLIISTSRNVRTRALTGACLTISDKLRVIPIIGGVSLPDTSPSEIVRRVRSMVNVPTRSTPGVSTGTKVGVRTILRGIIRSVPTPANSVGTPLHTLVFSDCCSDCGNMVVCMELGRKRVRPNSRFGLVTANDIFGIIRYKLVRTATPRGASNLCTNRINCVANSVGALTSTGINSAIALASGPTRRPLPNCHRTRPVIFYNVCPISNTECNSLGSTLRGLQLGSTTLSFSPRASITLKFNFHYKFLKLLRVRVVRRQLRERCRLSLVAATPDMVCEVAHASNAIRVVSGPAGCPSPSLVRVTRRPMASTRVCTPGRCINGVVRLYRSEQKAFISVRCVSTSHISLRCMLPLTRVVCSFFSALGSHAENCTSFSCRLGRCIRDGLIGLSVVLGNRIISTLSFVVRTSGTCSETEGVTRGLGRGVPERLFRVPVRTYVNNGVVTERAMGTVHGSMLTGYCNNSVSHGGGLLRGRGRNGGHVHRLNSIRIPRRTFVTILGLSASWQ